jgi:predicted nucleic acid-binding protein
MIVADTGAIIALLDRSESHHRTIAKLFSESGDQWVIPWAVLPEVDYILATHLTDKVRRAFLADVADGAFNVEWGSDVDMARAVEIDNLFASLRIGLVDATVLAVAERLRADAIVTLDLKHFGAVKPLRPIKILPRDVSSRESPSFPRKRESL